jgi:uncharacterized protein YbjT (DUF2867 family)
MEQRSCRGAPLGLALPAAAPYNARMSSVAIAGASGVVGARVLQHILAREDVARVVALGRRPLEVAHAKLVSSVVDLRDAASVANALPDDLTLAFCCLGTTMKQAGSKEAFRAVDYDAVVAFATAAQRKGARRFLVVSALGANARSRIFYSRTKGEAEQALERLGFPQLTIVRPSFIDDEGARREHRLAEGLGLPVARALFSVVGRTHRYAPVSADVIGKAMVRLAFDPPAPADGGQRVRVCESDELQRLGA